MELPYSWLGNKVLEAPRMDVKVQYLRQLHRPIYALFDTLTSILGVCDFLSDYEAFFSTTASLPELLSMANAVGRPLMIKSA